MNASAKVQLDIKHNAEDLQRFAMDLRNWETEMKEKELKRRSEPLGNKNIPPPRNKIQKSGGAENGSGDGVVGKKLTKPIAAYDYSSWDKFDVEKACEDIDKSASESEESECEDTTVKNESQSNEGVSNNDLDKHTEKLKLIDQAFYEKELGNQFVKKEKWNEAIQCYTKAIELDSHNSIYYANRALCFIKLRNFKSAEVDSTVAIQLDKCYVKAYQRRAFARKALGQVVESKADYEEVLKLEPNNAQAKAEISKINQLLAKEDQTLKKPASPSTASFNAKSIFEKKNPEAKKTLSAQNEFSPDKKEKIQKATIEKTKTESKNIDVIKLPDSEVIKTVKIEKEEKARVVKPSKVAIKNSPFGALPPNSSIIVPVKKPPHLRSKKPLNRVKITEVLEESGCKGREDLNIKLLKENNQGFSRNVETNATIVEQSTECLQSSGPSLYEQPKKNLSRKILEVPKTCLHFQQLWKEVKGNPEYAYSFLKQIPATTLPKIFEDSMESDIFSNIIGIISTEIALNDLEFAHSFLLGLSKVKRFGSLVLFMSSVDKSGVTKIIEHLAKSRTEANAAELRKLYEL